MLVLLRWLARRRLATLHAWGAVLGWLAYLLSPAYRRRFDANAAQAGIASTERRQAIAASGRMIAELPWLWLRPLERALGERVRWHDDALIASAIERGRGLVLLTPHLGCFEVTAQAIAERFGARATLTVMYRPARQPWLRELQRTARERPGLATAPANLAGVRQMVRALRRGEAIGLLPDQVPPEGLGVWAPFFGRPAYTMTLAARLVEQTGAALLLIWAERLSRGAGYAVRVVAAPSLPADATDASDATDAASRPLACATTVNAAMEQLIRGCPQQYLWGYNRYKAPRRSDTAASLGAAA